MPVIQDNSIVHACDTKGIYYSWETASGKAIAAKGDLAKIKISQFEVDKNNSMMIATTFDQRLVRIELASGKITHELNSKLPPVIHLNINHKCDRQIWMELCIFSIRNYKRKSSVSFLLLQTD